MAFPFIFESNFEAGTNGEWDSETDTVSQLDFPHYSELARSPDNQSAPFTGAYCMRAVLSGGTADAFVSEGDMNIALAGTAHIAFSVFFSGDFDATADDTVHLFEFQGAANAIQAVVGFRYVAATDVINIGMGKLAPTSFSAIPIEKNTWYTVELSATIDDDMSDDGTLDLYITRSGDPFQTTVSATQVASLDQIAVTHGVLGVQNHLATTTGTILFDRFIMDDARVYPLKERFSEDVLLTKSSHVFLGPGELERVELMSGAGTDNVLTVYDTDEAETEDAGNAILELKNTANNELVQSRDNIEFHRGTYVTLSGTNPRAMLYVKQSSTRSPAMVRHQGLRA